VFIQRKLLLYITELEASKKVLKKSINLNASRTCFSVERLPGNDFMDRRKKLRAEAIKNARWQLNKTDKHLA
ncbi:hypothetical protein M5D96_003975, partial [Drosophila gunungcola]